MSTMEVVSESSVSEVSLKSTADLRTEDENTIGKVNGDMNGVSDGEMDVSQDGERLPEPVEENGVGESEENGMELMETEDHDSATQEDGAPVTEGELAESEPSDNNCEVISDVRTCDETNGSVEEVNGETENDPPALEESDSAHPSEPVDDDEATQESKEVIDRNDDSSSEQSKTAEDAPSEKTSSKEASILETPIKTGDSVSISLITPSKDSGEDDSCQEITPDKASKKKKSQPITNVTPRRSSRNLNKTKSYADEEKAETDDDDVQEVSSEPVKKNTIVVNDTKRLAEIAAVSKNSKGGKKEPTLVIIDTNSLMGCKDILTQNSSTGSSSNNSGRSWPVSVGPGAALFHAKSAVKVTAVSQQSSVPATPPAPAPTPAPTPTPKPVILPSLTDDMYVVEAPSFIVPYVYEKPPVNALKEFLKDLDKTIKEQEELKQKEEEKKEKEASVSETGEKEVDKEEECKDEKMEVDEEKVETKQNSELENKEDLDKDKSETKDNDDEKSVDEKEEKKEDKEKISKADDEDVKVVGESKKEETAEVLEDKTNIKKSDSYFDNPLGKFFMQIGINLVQEYVQQDLLRNQIRKKEREGKNCPPEVHMAISSLTRTLESSKENNEPFKFELKKCSLCNFKTESQLVLAHHLETPHTRNFIYRCNFCDMEVRSPHDILFHMEADHNVRGRLERTPAFHQCPNCPFEDNQKGKLSRHLLSCAKKYKPERNQEPPLEWEPPAKIPRVRGARGLPSGNVMYTPGAGLSVRGALGAPVPPLTRVPTAAVLPLSANSRARGRPPIYVQRYPSKTLAANIRSGMVFRPSSQPPVLLPAPYQLTTTQQLLSTNKSGSVNGSGAAAKLLQQPSISITPLPRGGSSTAGVPGGAVASGVAPPGTKPGRAPGSNPAKTSFVICEICDGYIKDLEQLRNHMQWIHKVKIHPKMIYNRPPLNCQKCQFRFFTDQGLERHLLGSHGLVTSSMQEAANKGKDGGRCPVCGRVYQWKLLNHVARDHSMSLKPAHLSYKCTVCTATFGMYKQFENHVYSAHSVVAKRVTDKKGGSSTSLQPSTSNTAPQVPLKINDEITIIPQPAKNKVKPAVGSPSVTATKTSAK